MSVPFVPAAKTAQVEMVYTAAGQIMENVYHVVGTADWTLTSLTALINDFVGWETTYGKYQRAVNVFCTKIKASDLSTQFGPISETAENIEGVEADGPFPNNVTVAVKWITGLRGRSHRGRTYHIGLPRSYVDASENQLGPTAITDMVTCYRALKNTAFTNSGILNVRSIRTANAYRTTSLMTPIVDAVLADAFVDSQRRRLPGHNRHR